ncbi:MAG: radical SAM protein [Hyphomicrobiales bacterium]
MLKYPIAIEIDLTFNCNYSCIYCRNGLIEDSKELDIKVIKRLLDEAKENKVFNINISGGEPTTHSCFKEIVKYLGEKNLIWNLTTNGSLLDSDLVILLKANNVNSIFITLSGMSEATDNYHKKAKNTFGQALKAIDLCLQHNIFVYVGFLLTPKNISEIDQFIELVKHKGLKAKLMRVKNAGSSINNKDLHIENNKFTQVQKKMIQELKEDFIIGEQNQKIEQLNCMAGKISCVIGADYQVYPCVMFLGEEQLGCGSIKNETLYNIWNTSEMLKEFRGDRIYLDACDRCGKKEICNGGCRANAFIKYGNHKYIDGECDYV